VTFITALEEAIWIQSHTGTFSRTDPIDRAGKQRGDTKMKRLTVSENPEFDQHIHNAISPTYPGKPMHQGMPPFDTAGPALSFYEFWPTKLFYIPITINWLLLSIRYGCATLPTVANPLFPVGGLVGESKEAILSEVGGRSRRMVARFTALTRHDDDAAVENDCRRAESLMREKAIAYPAVVKPDVGCRGTGVQIVRDHSALLSYLKGFPRGGRVMIQELVPHEGEAGVFYVRFPNEERGFIFSLTLKYFPFVTGDGKTRLRKLIENDRRAGLIKHVYLERHRAHLSDIIPKNQNFRLAFTGSHSRGAIFRNGKQLITKQMCDAFDRISHDIPEFYFGRFDVRFSDYRELQCGRGFKIIEINGAGGEATHIWDRKTPIMEAYRTLFRQYRYLFEIGSRNRRRGFSPSTLSAMWRAYWLEKKLTRQYPHTE
jgi:hypothetical protein